jgi:hypothetical protein
VRAIVARRATTIAVTVTLRYGGRLHRVEGARVSAAGVHGLTGRDGTARLRIRGRHRTLRVTATKERLLAGRASVQVPA